MITVSGSEQDANLYNRDRFTLAHIKLWEGRYLRYPSHNWIPHSPTRVIFNTIDSDRDK